MEKERILITGNAGALGKELTKKLCSLNLYEVYGIDKNPFIDPPSRLTQFHLDLRRKSAFLEIKKLNPNSIIHLGIIKDPQRHRKAKENTYYYNLESTSRLLFLCENIDLRKFIYLSSANLYGPSSHTTGLLTESFPLHGANKSPELRDLVTLDMMVQSFFWKKPAVETVILRTCNVVGANLKNAPSTYLSLDKIPYILGFDPNIQLIHKDDLINAICLCLKSNKKGIYNLAGKDVWTLSSILDYLKKPLIGLPEKLFRIILQGAFLGKKSKFPSSELDNLKYSCLIDDQRAQKDFGYKAQKSIKEILDEIKNKPNA